jgi:hypothetical protein
MDTQEKQTAREAALILAAGLLHLDEDDPAATLYNWIEEIQFAENPLHADRAPLYWLMAVVDDKMMARFAGRIMFPTTIYPAAGPEAGRSETSSEAALSLLGFDPENFYANLARTHGLDLQAVLGGAVEITLVPDDPMRLRTLDFEIFDWGIRTFFIDRR